MMFTGEARTVSVWALVENDGYIVIVSGWVLHIAKARQKSGLQRSYNMKASAGSDRRLQRNAAEPQDDE